MLTYIQSHASLCASDTLVWSTVIHCLLSIHLTQEIGYSNRITHLLSQVDTYTCMLNMHYIFVHTALCTCTIIIDIVQQGSTSQVILFIHNYVHTLYSTAFNLLVHIQTCTSGPFCTFRSANSGVCLNFHFS